MYVYDPGKHTCTQNPLNSKSQTKRLVQGPIPAKFQIIRYTSSAANCLHHCAKSIVPYKLIESTGSEIYGIVPILPHFKTPMYLKPYMLQSQLLHHCVQYVELYHNPGMQTNRIHWAQNLSKCKGYSPWSCTDSGPF